MVSGGLLNCCSLFRALSNAELDRVLGIDATRLRAQPEEDHGMACKIFRRLTDTVASMLEQTRRVLINERLVSMDEPSASLPARDGIALLTNSEERRTS